MVTLRVGDHDKYHKIKYYKTVLHKAGGERKKAKVLLTSKQTKIIYKTLVITKCRNTDKSEKFSTVNN